MFELVRAVVSVSVQAFVLSTMLNVGLTQKPAAILGYLKDWPFVLRMLVANFVLVPLVTIVILRLTALAWPLQAGLLLFGLCAGASFLIRLTQTAQHDLALGAAVMMLLMLTTVVYVPLVLPRFLAGIEVNAWAIARTLLLQLMLPLALGMLAARVVAGPVRAVQPWIARLAGISLYVVIATTLIGYFPALVEILGTGTILAGLAVIAAALGFGYLAGHGKHHHEDIGALGTAQRNTAAGLIIATENFTNPYVLVTLILVNTVGIVVLLLVARALSRDHRAEKGRQVRN